MQFSTIQLDVAGAIMTVRLNRPEVLNAFSADMSAELDTALRRAMQDDTIRCLVLTGNGRAFCAGQDLRQIRSAAGGSSAAAGGGLGAYLREKLNPLILCLRTMEKPVIAAVNGVAAGAGVSLALAADLRLCAWGASFKMAFVQLGLVPDAGATLALVQLVGYARAAEMCLLGEPVSAEQALQMGLVNKVVDDRNLPAATGEIAARLAALPPIALGLTKRALNRAWTATLDAQLECEALLQDAAGRTADHREAVAAFLAKRPPHFTGR